MDVFKGERLFMQDGRRILACVFPRGYVGEILIVAESLAIGSLMFFTEMTAAGFFPVAGIDAHQFGQLQEVADAACFFQGLIDLFPGT